MSTASGQTRNSRMDCLKAFAAILVLFGHVLTDMDELPEILQITETLVYAVHVPLFFAIAGFLCRRQPLGRFYRKKIRRILIPFFFFSALKIVYALFIAGPYYWERLVYHIADAYLYGDTYWFCYAIFLVFLCAPLLWKKEGTAGVGTPGLWLAAACAVGDTACGVLHRSFPPLFQLHRAIYYFPFFTLGYAVGQYQEPLRRWVHAHRAVPAAVGLCITAAYTVLVRREIIPETFFPAKLLTAFSLTYFLWLLADAMPAGQRVLRYLGDRSLQLMLLDSLYRFALFELASALKLTGLWLIVPITILDVLLSALTCAVAKRIPGVRVLLGLSVPEQGT